MYIVNKSRNMSRRLPQEIMEVFGSECSILRSSRDTEEERGETLLDT